jgi:hypothetical protein
MPEEATLAAMVACALWKVRLREAIRGGHARDLRHMDPGNEDCCELTGLLHDEASRILHRQFHAAAAEILEIALAGNPDAALEEMSAGTHFAMSLSALGRALRSRGD